MKKIRISLKKRSHDILIGYGLIRDYGLILKGLDIGKDAVVVTNRRLLDLYGEPLKNSLKKRGLSVRFELVPDSEYAKSIKVLEGLLDRISSYDKYREIFLIAFGGGVIGDLAGFVASVYRRGIPYVQAPTTLLSQVDSAIGGKVAIDLPIAKNLTGAFYQPKVILSDTSLLRSLSLRQMRNGLSEIIKYGIIKDKALFEYLERDYKKILALDRKALEFVISRSSAIKANFVEKDEFDRKGLRAFLNYGHTIGHAIEAASGYSKRYYHGEAIAIGMVGASRISVKLGMMRMQDSVRIEALIKNVGLPARIIGVSISRIYNAYLHDKKFIHRKNRFVLPTRIGSVKITEGVPERIVKDVIKGLL
ncbi:MAG: 3-dehydroquinate synthase [Candidatus Omnitrophica bacterium]|nr:3-dehydroquinate synthase [Candidatus Omnitrophota bacterium]